MLVKFFSVLLNIINDGKGFVESTMGHDPLVGVTTSGRNGLKVGEGPRSYGRETGGTPIHLGSLIAD